MQRISHRFALGWRRERIAVVVQDIGAPEPGDHLFECWLPGRTAQAEIGGIECGCIRRRNCIGAERQVAIPVVRIEFAGCRVRELVRGAAGFDYWSVRVAHGPETPRRIGEETGRLVDGRVAVGIDDDAATQPIFLQVARPAIVDIGAKHGQVQIVEILRAIECVDCNSRSRKRQFLVIRLLEDLQQCQRQVLDLVGQVVIAAGDFGCLLQDGQVDGKANRVRRNELVAVLHGRKIGD